jgi:hypothetical protein
LLDRGLPTTVTELTPDHLEAFVVSLHERRMRPTTIVARHHALSRFFGWLVAENELATSPMASIRAPAAQLPEPHVLTGEEIAALLAACDGDGLEDLRDAARGREVRLPRRPRSQGPWQRQLGAPILGWLFVVSVLSSRDLFSTCPTSVDAALERGVPGQNEEIFIAIARVVRFVPSPTVSSRGYDLDVRRVLRGGPAEPTQGLRVSDSIEGIDRGSAVLVLAEEIGVVADDEGAA